MTRPRIRVQVVVLTSILLAGGLLAARAVRGQAPQPPQPLAPIEILSVRPQSGGARITLGRTPDTPRLAARVSASGGGDAATIEEALQRVSAGEIAVAGGTYAVPALDLPPGVSIAGGYDPQTWAFAPLENPVILVPARAGDARALVTLRSGSRLSGVVVRGAAHCIELVGDGVIVEGVAVSHCELGLLARPESRGLITYTTFVRNTAGAIIPAGAEVAVQNCIFQGNGTPLVRGALTGMASAAARAAAVASSSAVADELSFPLPHRSNLFFGNATSVAAAPGETIYGSDPQILRIDPVFPSGDDERSDEVSAFVPYDAYTEDMSDEGEEGSEGVDLLPAVYVAPTFGRPEERIITAADVYVNLEAGDRAYLLDASHGNAPVVELTGSFTGWMQVPPTRSLGLLLRTDGNGGRLTPVAVTALGVVEPENLLLDRTRDTSREALTGSTDGGPLGMTGAFDPRARWYQPIVSSSSAPAISADEEADLRALEDALAALTRRGLVGDPVVRDDDDGWVPLPLDVGPGEQYLQTLDGPPRRERSVNALLSDAGVTRAGKLRRVLIDTASLAPATENTRTRQVLITGFSLESGPSIALEEPTIDALIAAVEGALGISPSRSDEVVDYLWNAYGTTATATADTLERLAFFYGTDVTGTTTDDTRREVPVADWLKALLARRRGDALAVPSDYDAARCPTPTSCGGVHAPLLPAALVALPEDEETRIVAPSAATTDGGPWADVEQGAPPLALPLGGRLSSTAPLSAIGLRGNGGRAALTFRVVAARTADTTLVLQRLEGPAMSAVTVTVRAAGTTTRFERAAATEIRSVDDTLGTFPLAAGEPVEVRVEGATLLVGTLTLRAGPALASALTAPLTSATPDLTATGGEFGQDGWTTDAAIAALSVMRPIEASGVRVDLRVAGLPSCAVGEACVPAQLLSVSSDDVQVRVASAGEALLFTVGTEERSLVVPLLAELPVSLELQRAGPGTLVRLSVGPARSARLIEQPLGAQLALTVGSLDPAHLTAAGLRFSNLRVAPLARTLPVVTRSARLAPVRRDAVSYVVYAGTDPASVRARSATAVLLPIATLRPAQEPVVTVTGFQNDVPLAVVAAVIGPSGEVSALSELRTVVPTADPDAPPPPAVASFRVAPTPETGGSTMGATGGVELVPASRLTLALGDRIVLDPTGSLPPNEAGLLVSWGVGRDVNVLTEPTAQHVYIDPGTYRPTVRILESDGRVSRVATPAVVVTPASGADRIELSLTPPTARVAAGEELGILGAFSDPELPSIPLTWRLLLDFGDGSAVLDDTDALRAAFLTGPAQVPVTHAYAEAGSYTVVLVLEDQDSVRRGVERATVLVGDVREVADVAVDVTPLDVQAGTPVRARLVDLPASETFLAWDFGDAPSVEDAGTMPTAPGLGSFQPPELVTTSVVQVLGDLPVFLRVRTLGGAVSLGVSHLTITAPSGDFSLEQQLLYGNVDRGIAGRSLALSRVSPDGRRTYITDVTIDRSGFVLLPVSPAQSGEPTAVVRDADGQEVLALDGASQVRTALPLTAEPSLRGFTITSAGDGGAVTLDVDFDTDATVTTASARRGILVSDLAEGVTFGTADGAPALLRGGVPLLTLDVRRIPRLAAGATLDVPTTDGFHPLQVELLEQGVRAATLRLVPDGPVRTSSGGGEGFVLQASTPYLATVNPTATLALRAGDTVVLAARDARGVLSKDLASLTIREEDLAAGRAPAVGVASPGTRQLVPLGTVVQSLRANDAQPTIFGVAPPGSTVTVTTRSVEQRYTVQTDAQGTWRLVPSHPLEEGSHTVDVEIGDVRATVPLDVDLTAPDPPRVTGVVGATLTGVAEPGTTVAFVVPGREDMGAVLTSLDGRFRLTARAKISTILLKAVDVSGNASATTRIDVGDLVRSAPSRMTVRESITIGLSLGGLAGFFLLIWTTRRRTHPHRTPR